MSDEPVPTSPPAEPGPGPEAEVDAAPPAAAAPPVAEPGAAAVAGPGDVPPAVLDAVALAREAAVDAADGAAAEVGAHVTVRGEDTPDTATHYFVADKPGYRGWYWAATLAATGATEADGESVPVSVSEVVLLPGPDAITAPAWVPWTERVRAEDLSPGDLLPVEDGDERLVPAHAALDPDDDPGPGATEPGTLRAVGDELGLGRARVMSPEGRLDAALRWADGEFGPDSDMARSTTATCGTCGFFLRLASDLRAAFGVCGNGHVPADGHVVHVGYGCGGHSELAVDTGSLVAVADVVYDDGAELEPASS